MSNQARIPYLLLALGALAAPGYSQLATADLGSGLTPEDLVSTLLGGEITVSNVEFRGAGAAAGRFTGGTGIIGFESGILLSSGGVGNVVAAGGMNDGDSTTSANGQPGDPDLDTLIPGFSTFDAAVLEFDFECESLQVISFEYVFSSEEYNEYVNTPFNDVFGFFLNGVNVALLPDGMTPVSINTVNGGGPDFGVNPSNPAFYVNNDCDDLGGAGSQPCFPFVATEMDGLTVSMTVFTPVAPGVNHIKLAIADAGDPIFDSAVFIKGESFVCAAPNQGCVLGQGYWENHPGAWPVSSLTLGTVTYDQPELQAILAEPVRRNGLVSLAHQLVAARLNEAAGAGPPPIILDALEAADTLIGKLVVPPHGSGYLQPRVASPLVRLLDAYNSGQIPDGPPRCDD